MVLVMRIFDKTELSKAQVALLATEAMILRQLHHPNIVEIISELETEARLCQVFELSVVSSWFCLNAVSAVRLISCFHCRNLS